MVGRVQQGLAVLAVVWAIIAAFGAVRGARAQPPDPMAQLEAEFSKLARDLPPAGEVGYLERYEDAGAEDAVRTHYAAQYALVTAADSFANMMGWFSFAMAMVAVAVALPRESIRPG